MYSVKNENSKIEKGEVRIELENDDRIAITRYSNPKKDLEGEKLGELSCLDIIASSEDGNFLDVLNTKIKKITGKKYTITQEVIEQLEMLNDISIIE